MHRTPWTVEFLDENFASSPGALESELAYYGLPDNLRKILMLAGAADTRVLIIDKDAYMLDNLNTHLKIGND